MTPLTYRIARETAAWRDAYRRFGAKPAEHRSDIEALAVRLPKEFRFEGTEVFVCRVGADVVLSRD